MDLGKLLAKYQTLGGQIDVVYQELVKYEDQVKRNIKMLNELADENVKFSIDLDQYIATGYVLQNKIKMSFFQICKNVLITGIKWLP